MHNCNYYLLTEKNIQTVLGGLFRWQTYSVFVGRSVHFRFNDNIHWIYSSHVRVCRPTWHRNLTQALSKQIVHVQKQACWIIISRAYSVYQDALKTLSLNNLLERRSCEGTSSLHNSTFRARLSPLQDPHIILANQKVQTITEKRFRKKNPLSHPE